jgi:WD40 repeat protein
MEYQQEPLEVLKGHGQSVSAICWPHPAALYSGSWDHTIRQWDVKTGDAVSTWVRSNVFPRLALCSRI